MGPNLCLKVLCELWLGRQAAECEVILSRKKTNHIIKQLIDIAVLNTVAPLSTWQKFPCRYISLGIPHDHVTVLDMTRELHCAQHTGESNGEASCCEENRIVDLGHTRF